MTQSVLLPENIARVTRRDGAAHSITEFEPPETALLVVDMQNFYMVESRPNFCAGALAIVDNINRLADAMRRAGALVVWLRNVTSNEAFRSWNQHYDRMKPEVREMRSRDLARDSETFQLWPELDARDEDHRIDKTRYSPFTEGASSIRTLLGEHGTRTLVICGIVTNVCVESTARDAMMLNYRTLVVEDACAANSEMAHVAALNTFYTNFGDVQTTDEVIRNLGVDGKAAAAE